MSDCFLSILCIYIIHYIVTKQEVDKKHLRFSKEMNKNILVLLDWHAIKIDELLDRTSWWQTYFQEDFFPKGKRFS